MIPVDVGRKRTPAYYCLTIKNKAMEVKSILQSCHDRVESGKITLRQAAEELCRAGWTYGYIDINKTAKLIDVPVE